MQFPFGPDSDDENDKKNKNGGDRERGKRVNPLGNPFLVRAMEQRAEVKGAALEAEPMGAMDLSMKMGRRLLDQARRKEGALGARLRAEMETAGFSFGSRGAIGFKDPKEQTRGGDGREPGQGTQTRGGDGREPGQGTQTRGGDGREPGQGTQARGGDKSTSTSIALTPGRGAKRQEGQPMQTTEMVRSALNRPFGGEGARNQGDPLAFLNARLPDTDEDDLLEAEGLISAAETTLAEQSANADDPLTAKLIATRAEEAKAMMAALAGEKAIRETSVPSPPFETPSARAPQDEGDSGTPNPHPEGSSTRRNNPHPEEGSNDPVSKGEAQDTPATEALLEGADRARQAGPADGIQIASADSGIQSDAAAPLGQQAQSGGAEPENSPQVAQAIPPGAAPSNQPMPTFRTRLRDSQGNVVGVGERPRADDPQAWQAHQDALDKAGVGAGQHRAFREVWAAEGGLKSDGDTVAGITPDTLKELHEHDDKRAKADFRALGIDPKSDPASLTPEQRVQVYQVFFDGHWNPAAEAIGQRIGQPDMRGRDVLDYIGDPEAAAALADTFFRGSVKGKAEIGRVVQIAINATRAKVGQAPINADGVFGSGSIDAYKDLAADPKSRKLLLDHLADERRKLRPSSFGEAARADHFRIER